MKKYFEKNCSYPEYYLASVLYDYNSEVSSSSSAIKNFITEAEKSGRKQALDCFNYGKDNNMLIPAEATFYILSLYELDKSAARRLIYNNLHASPKVSNSIEFHSAKWKLVDFTMTGVADKIEAASAGFSDSVRIAISQAYQNEICNIMFEMEKIVRTKAYWDTLRNEIDRYMEDMNKK